MLEDMKAEDIIGEYKEAIRWGKKGQKLKESSGLDTLHDTSHNLALAERDSGNVSAALTYFLRGKKVDEVVAAQKPPFFQCPSGQDPGRLDLRVLLE